MKRSAITVLIFTVALTLSVGAYVSPYWAVRQLQQAAQAGDAGRISEYVDYPALRESLKADMQARIVAPMLGDPKPKDSPYAALGAAIAGAILGPMVDSMVTPAGIAAMMKGGPTGRPQAAPLPETSSAPPEASRARGEVRSGYSGINQFEVAYPAEGEPAGHAPALVFKRDGVFSWKLTKVRLPELPAPARAPQ
jgi:hypothetical protein